MKKIIYTVGFLVTLALFSCNNGSGNDSSNSDQHMNYNVTCTLQGKAQHDSATLLVLEEEYNQLRECGGTHAQNGAFTFTGQTDKPKVALIRWDNDSVKPFYFVLESGDIHITIKDGAWVITGSPLNSEYLHYINQRNDIMNARVATWQEYLTMASKSSLKRNDEQRMVRQDSLLNDSLQRITVERINRGDVVGRIIKQQFGQQLDQEHMRELK